MPLWIAGADSPLEPRAKDGITDASRDQKRGRPVTRSCRAILRAATLRFGSVVSFLWKPLASAKEADASGLGGELGVEGMSYGDRAVGLKSSDGRTEAELLASTVRSLADADDTSNRVLSTLHGQTEQLNRIKADADAINHNLDQPSAYC
ncbi:unnamed protein product [Effrenium voratum]|uniref:t-SNARE coiled-coil homology domain-containing protein n=1 Tax=Effrenium voratum TaxID=2562239 RepID=A0AA36HYK0_9DINO|nr:unnamed protein product [Effrenium voratum]